MSGKRKPTDKEEVKLEAELMTMGGVPRKIRGQESVKRKVSENVGSDET